MTNVKQADQADLMAFNLSKFNELVAHIPRDRTADAKVDEVQFNWRDAFEIAGQVDQKRDEATDKASTVSAMVHAIAKECITPEELETVKGAMKAQNKGNMPRCIIQAFSDIKGAWKVGVAPKTKPTVGALKAEKTKINAANASTNPVASNKIDPALAEVFIRLANLYAGQSEADQTKLLDTLNRKAGQIEKALKAAVGNPAEPERKAA